ncbi:MAG: Zn-ribbon domain-containing OB-fold protein [Dehalococcoidia bacterium]|nr:Zn-ribbon domain-containing OB-fold protein [Dehalococcoidia bacterium]MYA54556.1 Zn-ribbon domain-containing OB-fold protein [Dehalococcoidia bacterium]
MSAGDASVSKPVPVPDEITAPFWEAANRGVLAIQHCGACERYIHPPAAICPHCQATDMRFREVSGRARVYTHTIVRDNVTQGFAPDEPYVIGIIELVEQERLVLVANVVGVKPEDVSVGMPLRVTFERLNDEIALPQFTPDGGD